MTDPIENDYDGHMDGHPEHSYSDHAHYADPESYMPLSARRRQRRFWLTDSSAEAAGSHAVRPGTPR